MKYPEAKEHLYSDGSLRDVYVLDTTDRDLNAFMDYVRPLVSDGDYCVGGEPADFPDSYFESIAGPNDLISTLSISVGRGIVNCHFFNSSELELDFVPSVYDDGPSWADLSSFLQGLSNTIGKDVIVTAENIRDCVHMRFCPQNDEAESGPGSN